MEFEMKLEMAFQGGRIERSTWQRNLRAGLSWTAYSKLVLDS